MRVSELKHRGAFTKLEAHFIGRILFADITEPLKTIHVTTKEQLHEIATQWEEEYGDCQLGVSSTPSGIHYRMIPHSAKWNRALIDAKDEQLRRTLKN